MWLDPWMIAVLIIGYGVCYWHSFNSGKRDGICVGYRVGEMDAVERLKNAQIIKIDSDGNLEPGVLREGVKAIYKPKKV